MARYLCDFYVYKASQQLVAKYVNAILTEGEAQASANAFLKQHSATRVCVVNRGSMSGSPRAPIKTTSTALPANTHCWVVAPQVAATTVTCPPGYVFENGKCVIKSPISNCPPGTKLDPTGKLCVPILKTGPGGRVLRKPGIVAGPFDDVGQSELEHKMRVSNFKASAAEYKPVRQTRLHGLPFALGNVGDPVSLTSKYKGILVLWGNTPGVSKSVPNYGTVAEDLSPTWNCLRDGRMLAAFSKWWNSKGNKLSEGSFPFSGPCKGILVADLDAPHMAALDAFAAGATGVVDPNAAGQWPTTQDPSAALACADICQKNFGAASPGGLNLTELMNCLAQCGAKAMPPVQPIPGGTPTAPGDLPPPPAPKPPQGGTPPPSGVQDCDGKNPCPAGQVCVGGKCQPALPPPPSAPAPTKSSNTALWVAGGVAALGAAFLIFGGGKSELLLNPRRPSIGQPFRLADIVMIEKRKSDGSLDFTAPQPPKISAKFEEIYQWMFRDDPNATGSWEDLEAWLNRRGWVLRKKTW